MRLVAIIAIGDSKWGQMALNCALSIKSHDFNQKIALITDGCATKGMEYDIERFFDYQTIVNHKNCITPQEKSFYTKVNLYEIVFQKSA